MKPRESINSIFTDIRNALISKKEVLTVPELEKYMGISKSTIYKMTHERRIPHYKPTGKLIFFKRAEIDQWMLTNPVEQMLGIYDRVAGRHIIKNKKTVKI